MYDYEDYSEPFYCCHCDQKSENMNHAADHMVEVIKMLYGKDRLDVDKLEDHLDEVCHVLGIKLPSETPTVERKRSELFSFAMELTRGYAQNF